MGKPNSSTSADPPTVCRITVERNIVGEFCLELEKRFQAEMKNADCPVVLDLSRVKLIDSRGIA